MDKDLAFSKINEIFFALENENKSHFWQLEEVRKVLKQMQDDVYRRGIARGRNESIEILISAKKE